MDVKEQLLQELEQVSEPLLSEVLDFLQFLKAKESKQAAEDKDDLAEARAILKEVELEGSVSWDEMKAELGL